MRARRRRARVPRLPIAGFPRKKVVKFRYATTTSLNAAPGTSVIHDFAANGLYDPDITGAGHQPIGFDEWMAVYSHYTVIASKMTVRNVVSATQPAPTGAWGIVLAADSNQWGHGLDIMLEAPTGLGRYRLSGQEGGLARGLGGHQLTKYFSAKKVFGGSIMGNDELRGHPGSNPAELQHFILWAGAANGSIDPGTMYFIVTIDYVAVLTERKLNAGS